MTDRHPQPGQHGHHGHNQDRFMEMGESATGFMEEHLKSIVIGALALLAIGIGWAAMEKMGESRAKSIQADLAEIAAVFPGDPGMNVPDSSVADAISRYKAFIAEHGSGIAADMARLNLGLAHEKLGQIDQAKAAFESTVDGSATVAAVALMRMGYLQIGANDLPAAGKRFQQVVNEHPGLAPQAALELGRVAELAGATDVAIERYSQTFTSFANTPQSAEAAARITALGGTIPGVEAPTAVAEPGDTPVDPAAGESKGDAH